MMTVPIFVAVGALMGMAAVAVGVAAILTYQCFRAARVQAVLLSRLRRAEHLQGLVINKPGERHQTIFGGSTTDRSSRSLPQ